MEESSLMRLQRKHFIETCCAMLDWWIDTFPAAIVAKEQRVKMNGVVRGNDDRERAFLSDWHSSMSTPLSGSVKYAAALRRILGKDATVYHACEYHDLTAAMGSVSFDILCALDPEACIAAHPECKVQMWKLLKQLNQYCVQYFDVELSVPTRDEIQSNIKMHKATKPPSKPAMTRGFEVVCEELASHLECSTRPSGDYVASWSAQTSALSPICERKSVQELKAVPFSNDSMRKMLEEAEDSKFDDHAWKLISQLNSFSGMQGTIPPNMMNRIESTAHRIAGEIACGKTDLGSLNLAQLGQTVLEGCDTQDVQQLAQGMGSLLPMLQSLQGSMSSCPASGPSAEAPR